MHSCMGMHESHTTQLCIVLPTLLVEWQRCLGVVVVYCPVPLLALHSHSALESQRESQGVTQSHCFLESHCVLESQSLLESQSKTPELPTGNLC